MSSEFSPSRENSSRISRARRCCQLCKTCGLPHLSSSILSPSDNLDSSSSSSSNVNTAAVIPRSHANGHCAIAGRLRFFSFPSSLQGTLGIFRHCPIPASTPCSLTVAAIPISLRTDGGATDPRPTGISILTDQPAGVSAIPGAGAGGISAVTRGFVLRRLLTPFGVASGEVKERRSGSILQGLREVLEELTVLFWKGNRWKGPQKNKWKWYHRHGYWATRKKLIDFTKYRRYGYHERYGMGRPKMKFWEDPSRYKRLRQAVRFW